jgi:6-phosphofructokinase 2
VTLTVNPTVDIACDAELVRPIHKVRTNNEMQDPGGGGVNVARVVHELGGDVLSIVMTGGFPGRFLEELMAEEGVPTRVVPIAGRTRISYTVNDRSCHQEFRFVAEGPEVSENEWLAALAAVEEEKADWVVGSGSLAPGMPEDFYVRLAAICARKGAPFVLDTSGAPLRAALGKGLAMIKPSLGEFEKLVGHPLRRSDELAECSMAMVRSGASERIAVTSGREGAMLASKSGVCRLAPVEVDAKSAVGAGDSFTGAMVLALARGASDEDAFAWGMAGGAAAVMHTGTAHPKRADVERLHATLHAA